VDQSFVNNSAVKNSDLTQGVSCRCSTGVQSLLLECHSLDVTISRELTCKFSLIFIYCVFGRVKRLINNWGTTWILSPWIPILA